MNSNAPKTLICFLLKFPETKCSDEIFDYMKSFILVAFPPLTLDHLLKTVRKETNKHSSFIMKRDNRTFYKQSVFYSERNHVILTRYRVGIIQPSTKHSPQNIYWYYLYYNYQKRGWDLWLSQNRWMLAWPLWWSFGPEIYQSISVII